MPEGVRLVVGRRVERLSDVTPALLTATAVVGRRFELGLVEALGGLDSDPFLDAIEEAEAAKLIASERTGRWATYVFTHELVRSTLLGALSLPRRQRLHARVAEAIETLHTSDLTPHASALARSLGDWDKAIEDWTTALPLYEAQGDRGAIATLCQELALHYIWTGQPDLGVATARRGLAALGPEASPDRCRLLGHLGWNVSMACDREAADRTMRDARSMADALGDPALRGEMLLLSAGHDYYCMRRHDQAEACQQAVELTRPTRDLGKLRRRWRTSSGRPSLLVAHGRSARPKMKPGRWRPTWGGSTSRRMRSCRQASETG